jgi:hypothetical protein
MTYKDFTIYANAQSYSLWSIDDNGRLNELEHEFEGYDFISYTFGNDEVLDGEYGDFETLDECKQAIDKLGV